MVSQLHSPASRQELLDTYEAIRSYVHRTPVLTSSGINQIAGCKLFFKCENFQHVGAFKMRGASRAALALSSQELQRGLATHSSGNHAQAVAKTALLLNVPAHIVMPENAPAVKRNATRDYGAQIYHCKPTLEAREIGLEEVISKTGATFIHPYDNYDVIAGQATAAMELLQDCSGLHSIIAPVGGGGLMSGTCLAAYEFAPGCILYGSEPAAVDDAKRSLDAGRIIRNTSTETIADGLKTNLSSRTFAILQSHLKDILTVTEEEIKDALKLILQRLKIVVEPSSAVPLAAVLRNKQLFENQHVGVILTGGNVELALTGL